MNLKRSKVVITEVPIYGGTFVFSYKTPIEKVIKDNPQLESLIEGEKLDYDAENCGGLTSSNGFISYVSIGEHDTMSNLMNTVNHEIFHVVYRILKVRGLKLSTKSQEAYAYLSGYLMEQLWK